VNNCKLIRIVVAIGFCTCSAMAATVCIKEGTKSNSCDGLNSLTVDGCPVVPTLSQVVRPAEPTKGFDGFANSSHEQFACTFQPRRLNPSTGKCEDVGPPLTVQVKHLVPSGGGCVGAT